MSCAGTSFNRVINIVYDNTLRGAAALPISTDAFPAFLQPKVEICFSRHPLTTEHIDLYVVPAVTLPLNQKFQSPQPYSAVPVLAYGPESLLPLAFDCGCCDYLRSPWALNELKVRALRALPPRQLEFEWGTISLERKPERKPERKLQGAVLRLLEPPTEIALSGPETAILRLLILQSGTPVSRECLQAGLRRPPGTTPFTTPSRTPSPAGRSVDVHISTLRKKFNLLSGKLLQPHPIRSIYGYGYVLIHKHSTPYSCCG